MQYIDRMKLTGRIRPRWIDTLLFIAVITVLVALSGIIVLFITNGYILP